jgi:hypothetical protein
MFFKWQPSTYIYISISQPTSYKYRHHCVWHHMKRLQIQTQKKQPQGSHQVNGKKTRQFNIVWSGLTNGYIYICRWLSLEEHTCIFMYMYFKDLCNRRGNKRCKSKVFVYILSWTIIFGNVIVFTTMFDI